MLSASYVQLCSNTKPRGHRPSQLSANHQRTSGTIHLISGSTQSAGNSSRSRSAFKSNHAQNLENTLFLKPLACRGRDTEFAHEFSVREPTRPDASKTKKTVLGSLRHTPPTETLRTSYGNPTDGEGFRFWFLSGQREQATGREAMCQTRLVFWTPLVTSLIFLILLCYYCFCFSFFIINLMIFLMFSILSNWKGGKGVSITYIVNKG